MRRYNKYRKQIFLGLDDKKRKLYVWDFVKLTSRIEMKTPWISQIYWNPLDGAFIDSHPGHIAMNAGRYSTRDLRHFMGEKYDVSHMFRTEEYIPNCSIEKVSYKDYLDWKKSIEGKYDEVTKANIERENEARKNLEEE